MRCRIMRWLMGWQRRNERKLRGILRELGAEHYLNSLNIARIPFQLRDAKHFVVLALDGEQLLVEGISRLIFSVGHAPKPVIDAIVRRNRQLSGLQWIHSTAFGSEWFCIGLRMKMADVSAANLWDRINAIIEEMERCRLILAYVREQHRQRGCARPV